MKKITASLSRSIITLMIAAVAGLTGCADFYEEVALDMGSLNKDDFIIVETMNSLNLSVVSIQPMDDATTTIDTTISVTFNHPINNLTVSTGSFILQKNGEIDAISGTFTYENEDRTVIFTPDVYLDPLVTYNVTITPTLADTEGNSLSADLTWSFTTNHAPSVVSTIPASGATNILPDAVVTATFNENLNCLTVTDASFRVEQGGVPIDGLLNCTGDTVTFTPSSTLSTLAYYTGRIETTVTDEIGNELVDPYSWTFRAGGIPTVNGTLSFSDQDHDVGQIQGDLVITKAADESTVTHYELYWGTSGGAKIATGAFIDEYAVTGADITHAVSANTDIPAGAFYFLLYSKNVWGEKATPALLTIPVVHLEYRDKYTSNNIREARNSAISQDGKHVYVIGRSGSDTGIVAWFDRDAFTGALTYVDRYTETGTDFFPYTGAQTITISPDGKHVYILSLLNHSVAWFSRSSTTGALAKVGYFTNTSDNNSPSNIVISPDGGYAYIIKTGYTGVALYTRDSGTGALTWISNLSHTNISAPHAMVLSPDGSHAYITNRAGGAAGDGVAWFTRDSGTGALAYAGYWSSADTEYDYVCNVAISPGGENIYITSSSGNTVTWFTRDSGTGALSYGNRYTSSTNLEHPVSITVSPDGANVYIIGQVGRSIAWFTRDSGTGALTYTDRQSLSMSPYVVMIDPGGSDVYVAGFDATFNGSIAWFFRQH